MPNWVKNSVVFTAGTEKEIQEFVELMIRPRPFAKPDPEKPYLSLPYSPENMEYGDPKFSLWNVVSPEESILPEYWGPETQGLSLADALKNETNHWYDWNIRNWGCKWDASAVHDEGVWGTGWRVSFETPWSPPVEAYKAIAARFPNIHMRAECIEEQGWGVVYVAVNGSLEVEDEWDINEMYSRRMNKVGLK